MDTIKTMQVGTKTVDVGSVWVHHGSKTASTVVSFYKDEVLLEKPDGARWWVPLPKLVTHWSPRVKILPEENVTPVNDEMLTRFTSATEVLIELGYTYNASGWVAPECDPLYRGSFKNFHRLLCERFGYRHDDKAWYRDQSSLIEFIARKASIVDAFEAAVADARASFTVVRGRAEAPRV